MKTKEEIYTTDDFVNDFVQIKTVTDKKYTEEDIKEMACDFVINVGGLPKDLETWQTALWKFYQHLNKQD